MRVRAGRFFRRGGVLTLRAGLFPAKKVAAAAAAGSFFRQTPATAAAESSFFRQTPVTAAAAGFFFRHEGVQSAAAPRSTNDPRSFFSASHPGPARELPAMHGYVRPRYFSRDAFRPSRCSRLRRGPRGSPTGSETHNALTPCKKRPVRANARTAFSRRNRFACFRASDFATSDPVFSKARNAAVTIAGMR